jgi:hypothetical protein
MATITGPIYTPDGTVDVAGNETSRRGRLGDAIVSELHGAYESASRGNVYTASTAATGIALIVPATTGNHPTLWNPSGNVNNLNVLKLILGYISGTNAPSTIEWAQTNNTGPSIVAVNGPIITFTSVAPTSVIVGNAGIGTAKWAPAVNTFVAAPVFFRTTGLSLFTGAAATAVAPFQLEADYQGDLIVAPGNAISLCTQQATSTALFQITIIYEEIPA